MPGVIFAAFAHAWAINIPEPSIFTGHAMNAYRFTASMPSPSPEKRDAGLRASQRHPVPAGFLHSSD
jgi:hypothetical protein